MNLFARYMSSAAFLRSPDEPAAPEPVVTDPVLVADPVDPQPAPTAGDPAPAPEPAPAPKAPAMVPLRVMQERIGEESGKRTAAEQRAAEAEERARNFEAIVQRLQSQQPPVDPSTVAPRATAAPAAPVTVEQQAQQLLLQRDLEGVSQAGAKAFGAQWGDAIAALNSYGANSTEFVASVMDVDRERTHEIMFQIAQDPEKAVQLARMTPTRRIAEITRMVMTTQPAAEPKSAPAAEPKPAPAISRAPAPAPRVAPLAPAAEVDPTTAEGNDKMDDKQWGEWYRNKYMKRA